MKVILMRLQVINLRFFIYNSDWGNSYSKPVQVSTWSTRLRDSGRDPLCTLCASSLKKALRKDRGSFKKALEKDRSPCNKESNNDMNPFKKTYNRMRNPLKGP